MIKGLAGLLGSVDSKNPAQYLQCLTDNGYGAHAGRIHQLLSSKLDAAKSALSKQAGWSDAQFGDNSCERLEKVEVLKENGKTTTKKLTEVVPETASPTRLFTCGKPDGNEYAHFDPNTDTVKITSDATRLSNGYGIAKSDAYGSVLMHELLHYSGMNTGAEEQIGQIQNCCAPSKFGEAGRNTSCNFIRSYMQNERLLAAASQTPGYVDLERMMRQKLPPSMVPDFMERFTVGFANSPEGKASIKSYQACAKDKGGDENALRRCSEPVLVASQKFAEKFIPQTMCPIWRSHPSISLISCSTLTQTATDALQYNDPANDIIVNGSSRRIVESDVRAPAVIIWSAEDEDRYTAKLNEGLNKSISANLDLITPQLERQFDNDAPTDPNEGSPIKVAGSPSGAATTTTGVPATSSKTAAGVAANTTATTVVARNDAGASSQGAPSGSGTSAGSFNRTQQIPTPGSSGTIANGQGTGAKSGTQAPVAVAQPPAATAQPPVAGNDGRAVDRDLVPQPGANPAVAPPTTPQNQQPVAANDGAGETGGSNRGASSNDASGAYNSVTNISNSSSYSSPGSSSGPSRSASIQPSADFAGPGAMPLP
ncbi:MAG: hypothetical protein EOP05_11975, partial [Proteobacteria bacterium]